MRSWAGEPNTAKPRLDTLMGVGTVGAVATNSSQPLTFYDWFNARNFHLWLCVKAWAACYSADILGFGRLSRAVKNEPMVKHLATDVVSSGGEFCVFIFCTPATKAVCSVSFHIQLLFLSFFLFQCPQSPFQFYPSLRGQVLHSLDQTKALSSFSDSAVNFTSTCSPSLMYYILLDHCAAPLS